MVRPGFVVHALMRTLRTLAPLCCLLVAALPAHAREAIPPELAPWVPWVLEDHPDVNCVSTPNKAPCIWAGDVAVEVDDRSGSFRMRVWLERPAAVPLPGGPGQWPFDVRSNTGAATVSDDSGRPMLFLPKGGHVVGGRFSWEELPQSLVLPPEAGTVSLSVRGEAVDQPRVDADGTLHLDASGDGRVDDGDALELDVTRHIIDGVPVRVRTRLALRVAGGARELDLGPILLEGTRAVSVEGELPVRVGDGQRSVAVQVRPGTWEVVVEAIHDGPVSSLAAPSPDAAGWPAAEFWSVATDDAVRSVHVQGGAGIDPARTPIPASLHAFPAFLVQPGDQLTFEEMRRGVPSPPPNQLQVSREMWIDADGGGLTVRDSLRGRMESGWRVDVAAPLEPGHVSVGGTDQVITRDDRGIGVEVRDHSVNLTAEGRIPSIWAALPAVGWAVDATELDVAVRLPPGWTALAAMGADSVSGTTVARWNLIEVLVVVVVAGLVGRLLGVRTGVVVLLAMVTHRESIAGLSALFATMAAVLGLARHWRTKANTRRHTLTALKVLHTGLSGLLVLQLASMVEDDVRDHLFPDLTTDTRGVDPTFANFGMVSNADIPAGGEEGEYGSFSLASQTRSAKPAKLKKEGRKSNVYQTLQIDPTAVVQTGPGIPTWYGDTVRLEWFGRVPADHTFRLVLVPPVVGALFTFFRWLLLGLAAALVAGATRNTVSDARRLWKTGLPWLLMGVFVWLGTPGPAVAAPSPELLAELEKRLTAGPSCGNECVSVSRAWLRVTDDSEGLPVVRLRAEVHAVVDAGWAIPGPHTSWQPTEVRVDSGESYAVRRGTDGFLYVRVPAGVHTVTVEGRLANDNGLTLQFVDAPKSVRFDGAGFRLGGVRRDGTVDNTLQITRIQQDGDATLTTGTDNLSPRVTVRRSLDLGVPWQVTTEVDRLGPVSAPMTLEVPLLAGEAVTDAGREVRDGKVLVSFDGTERHASWTGTLALSEQLSLVAPEGVSWTEEWVLACSPIFACVPTASDGLAPIQHVADGKWQPMWRPWPGERLDIDLTRPDSIAGQTVTIDQVSLHTRRNAREAESKLEMVVRTSQGGQHTVTIPAESEITKLAVDGKVLPTRMEAGKVQVPLQPGSHRVVLTWRWSGGNRVLVQSPTVDFGAPAVNVTVGLSVPEEEARTHIPLATFGPRYGPKVLLWAAILILLGVAFVLGNFTRPGRTKAPFRTRDWALLLLGLAGLGAGPAAVVVAWTLALIVRSRRPPEHYGLHNLFQLALLGASPFVGLILLIAVVDGMTGSPGDLVVNHHGGGTYTWALDRADAALVEPVLLFAPGWSRQGLVLAWALWLVAAIAGRAGWIWSALGHRGWFRSAPKPPTNGGSDGAPPTPDAPDPEGPENAPVAPEPVPDPASASAPTSGTLPMVGPEAFRGTGTDHTRHTLETEHDETMLAYQPVAPPRGLDHDTEEIVAEPDSFAPDETSSFDAALIDVPDHAYQGRAGASVSLLGGTPKRQQGPPAFELPYDGSRHVEIGPPVDEDAVFIPAIDADPSDYAAATGFPSPKDDEDDA